jgi:hypothetical protein
VAVEDLQDHHGAVQHLAANLLRQVEGLRRGDLVVDEDQPGSRFQDFFLELFPFAGAKVGRRVEAGALLRERGDHLEAERLRQLAQLGQRGAELGVADARSLDRGHYGAHQAFSRIWRNSAGKAWTNRSSSG